MGKNQPYGSRKNRTKGFHLSWSEVRNISKENKKILAAPYSILVIAFSEQQFLNLNPEQRSEIFRLNEIITNDNKAYEAEIMQLDAKYESCKGRVTEYEAMSVYNAVTEYQDWIQRYQSTMFPLMFAVADILNMRAELQRYFQGDATALPNLSTQYNGAI